jgi:F1F0 ATPase subunit 2
MNEVWIILLALLAGVLLGTIFFGGLWWTVEKGLSSKQPAILFAVSMLLRTAVALGGFYYVSRGDWHRLVSCLVGFVIARLLVMRFTRVPTESRALRIEGGGA